eukprot:scaffold467894_cov39-Prasinocladus_malaysianus.AAC.1
MAVLRQHVQVLSRDASLPHKARHIEQQRPQQLSQHTTCGIGCRPASQADVAVWVAPARDAKRRWLAGVVACRHAQQRRLGLQPADNPLDELSVMGASLMRHRRLEPIEAAWQAVQLAAEVGDGPGKALGSHGWRWAQFGT